MFRRGIPVGKQHRKWGGWSSEEEFFIILLMQDLSEQDPFFIIHNARAEQSALPIKTSYSHPDRKKHKAKSRKPRKMTMNTDSLPQEQMQEEEQLKEMKQRGLEEGRRDHQEIVGWYSLELGAKVPSSKEMELQKGIEFGLGNESDLDDDFKCRWRDTGIDWVMFD